MPSEYQRAEPPVTSFQSKNQKFSAPLQPVNYICYNIYKRLPCTRPARQPIHFCLALPLGLGSFLAPFTLDRTAMPAFLEILLRALCMSWFFTRLARERKYRRMHRFMSPTQLCLQCAHLPLLQGCSSFCHDSRTSGLSSIAR